MKAPALTLVSVMTAGCAFHVATPPARMMRIEPVEMAHEGQTRVSFEGGAISVGQGGESFVGAQVAGAVGRGLGDDREARFGVTYTDFEPEAGYRDAWLATGYAEYAIGLTPALSVSIGGGSGISNYGELVSAHAGAVAGLKGGRISVFAGGFVTFNEPLGSEGLCFNDQCKLFTRTRTIDLNVGFGIEPVSLAAGFSGIDSSTDSFGAIGLRAGVALPWRGSNDAE